ncbi:MAG: hypothetical protein VX973_12260, partial [Pseudomonadota bacterium]|nr:hypothetical protein [Pseudomonadota bacterium]
TPGTVYNCQPKGNFKMAAKRRPASKNVLPRANRWGPCCIARFDWRRLLVTRVSTAPNNTIIGVAR